MKKVTDEKILRLLAKRTAADGMTMGEIAAVFGTQSRKPGYMALTSRVYKLFTMNKLARKWVNGHYCLWFAGPMFPKELLP